MAGWRKELLKSKKLSVCIDHEIYFGFFFGFNMGGKLSSLASCFTITNTTNNKILVLNSD